MQLHPALMHLFLLDPLWTEGDPFLWCISPVTFCYLAEPIFALTCLHRLSRNARVSTILTLSLWSPGCQIIPFENVHVGSRDKNFGHGNTLQETEIYDFFPWYWRNPDSHDGEQESICLATFDPLSTRKICKSCYPPAPGYSSPTGLYPFHTLLPALLPLQVTLPLWTISWLEIGVTESESSPATPGLPLPATLFLCKNQSFSSKSWSTFGETGFGLGVKPDSKNLHPFLSWCSPTGQSMSWLMFPGKTTMNSACCHLGWLQCQALSGGLCWNPCPLYELQAF